ncbi:hypothetical protein AK812_SmicGene49149 [Symbiodinium microadriaticum]|uniref:Uncharacterized protein n=1 Tax=Symbiodinium microadriaticum TaxID=2951 RepID=A0A1Q9DQF9_SYMMI|nr:hypothetical protein AK812_SmicGene49149 [Symbiodinium microadriaticum]
MAGRALLVCLAISAVFSCGDALRSQQGENFEGKTAIRLNADTEDTEPEIEKLKAELELAQARVAAAEAKLALAEAQTETTTTPVPGTCSDEESDQEEYCCCYSPRYDVHFNGVRLGFTKDFCPQIGCSKVGLWHGARCHSTPSKYDVECKVRVSERALS